MDEPIIMSIAYLVCRPRCTKFFSKGNQLVWSLGPPFRVSWRSDGHAQPDGEADADESGRDAMEQQKFGDFESWIDPEAHV